MCSEFSLWFWGTVNSAYIVLEQSPAPVLASAATTYLPLLGHLLLRPAELQEQGSPHFPDLYLTCMRLSIWVFWEKKCISSNPPYES